MTMIKVVTEESAPAWTVEIPNWATKRGTSGASEDSPRASANSSARMSAAVRSAAVESRRRSVTPVAT
jgi:hypothetical protein